MGQADGDEMLSYWLSPGSFIASTFQIVSCIIKRGDLEISHIQVDVHL
jgi:hypothetical protein